MNFSLKIDSITLVWYSNWFALWYDKNDGRKEKNGGPMYDRF